MTATITSTSNLIAIQKQNITGNPGNIEQPRGIRCGAVFLYIDVGTILTLNNMKCKVREYEIDKGIYKVNEGEHPYALTHHTGTANSQHLCFVLFGIRGRLDEQKNLKYNNAESLEGYPVSA